MSCPTPSLPAVIMWNRDGASLDSESFTPRRLARTPSSPRLVCKRHLSLIPSHLHPSPPLPLAPPFPTPPIPPLSFSLRSAATTHSLPSPTPRILLSAAPRKPPLRLSIMPLLQSPFVGLECT
ncbi:unnamed protein product [Closterium sp. Naga37s-1]|nr:unnamed protein product [Closterium sp. Naga37s-1]